MDNRKKDIVLLLTGTIFPNSFTTLKIVDPEERKGQYISAIKYYLKNTDARIVFSENSGTSLKKYFPGHSENLEFINFISEAVTPDRGKGYKEMEIIDKSMKKSNFIKESKGVIKITGRLKILNINRLILSVRKGLIGDGYMVQCNIFKKYKMDSRCFFYTRGFWSILKKNGYQVDNSYSFERALWDSVKDFHKHDDKNYRQFPEPLKIEGISGGFGISYKTDFKTMILRRIKHVFSWYFVYK
jgi:hypothetical protein